MAEDLDLVTIAKYVGVFVAALLLINAFEYLVDRILGGDLTVNQFTLLTIVLLVVLVVAIAVHQSQ